MNYKIRVLPALSVFTRVGSLFTAQHFRTVFTHKMYTPLVRKRDWFSKLSREQNQFRGRLTYKRNSIRRKSFRVCFIGFCWTHSRLHCTPSSPVSRNFFKSISRSCIPLESIHPYYWTCLNFNVHSNYSLK